MNFFEKWAGSLDWISGTYGYPRWLRRLYICTWPIAAPIRFLIAFFLFSTFFLTLIILSCIYEGVIPILDAIYNLKQHIKKQWN